MPEIEYQTDDNTARIAMVALAVILVLIGLLYMSSAKVSEQRANPDAAYAEAEAGGTISKLAALVHGKRVEIRESDSRIGQSIFGFGALLMLVATFWCGFAALGVHVGWGVAVWFTQWIGMLLFCSIHWEEGQNPALCFVAGVLFCVIGLSLI